MKMKLKQVQSFLMFDSPLEISNINTQFVAIHHQQQRIIPEWPPNSTRQKLIAAYWFTHVLGHFVALLGVAIVITSLIDGGFSQSLLLVILPVGLFSFWVMLFFHYLPGFSSSFLPKLEIIIAGYESRKQQEVIRQLQEQLAVRQEAIQHQFRLEIAGEKEMMAQQQVEIRKCRNAQLPTATLILIYDVLAVASGMNTMKDNKKFSILLMKLYGVSPAGLKQNMDLLFGSSIKKKNLTDRGRTEISNRFEEAASFFEEMNFLKGVEMVRRMEANFFNN
jgi:hypothetical protein